MHKIVYLFLFLISFDSLHAQQLPVWNDQLQNTTVADWLLKKPLQHTGVYRDELRQQIVFYNGLIKRSFVLSPDFTCVDFTNLSNHQQLIRAVQPEAKITIDGIAYHVGGLKGQTEKAYLLPASIKQLTSFNEFQFENIEVAAIQPRIKWNRETWSSVQTHGTGKHVTLRFKSSSLAVKDFGVEVHYEIYDALPLIVKWVEVVNHSNRSILINRIVNETLALVEEESAVVGTPEQMKKQHGIYVETNYAFNNAMRYDISDQTTHWLIDSAYTSQVNYNY